jgi:O-antigen/teichoic acid export membrane protein
MFIANSIEAPTRSLIQIAMPVVAASWAIRDMANIESVYKKSSLNLLIVGIPVFLCIWLCLPDLLGLTARPDDLLAAKFVVFWIGMSKLVDMATSINNQIIAYSPYFRFNLYIILVLGVLNFVLNLYLIPRYGVTGAAFATFFSLTVFNGAKLAFIRIRFGMQPFSRATWALLGLAIPAYLAGAAVGALALPFWASIPLKAAVVMGLFIPAILYFRISPDVNQLLASLWAKVTKGKGE